MIVHRFAAAVVLVATAAAVAFTYTGDPAPEPTAARAAAPVPSGSVAAPTGADLDFAQKMVSHHAQAVRMSQALIAKPGVPERIQAIAEFIVHDQQREITEMNAWLSAWGQSGAAVHDHGMISPAQEKELANAPVERASPLFLRLMIEHHRGAITMARDLLDGDGRNVYTHGLAKHVINEQSAENKAMAALL